ncbi:hypothetical protein PICMEDRAFT_13755 [Pichia membranifaciens NRRL Y-2026]|uniref:C2H2-type domain-containing protein n=1 Tax=Pichia membranifaciens NRRL Y-2026 TaxID=763406 RepID=A0A1E3NDJ8_9ASCO|nr:hypothetical protein PICMEDRAFT_13755 [Pichia membranifaciens NRRL Y-2026]ODQ44201.1 hypothetical protein PICMEDRAFT_13755 [Pichia membranifaciens NRRL Y-2026]
MLPHALPVYYTSSNDPSNQHPHPHPHPHQHQHQHQLQHQPNQLQTPTIPTTQSFTPISVRQPLDANRSMPALPYQEILPPLQSSPSQWKQQQPPLSVPQQQYYGTPISSVEYSSPNPFPGGLESSNERISSQRYFNCSSPQEYKRYPPQTGFYLQHGSIFNNNASNPNNSADGALNSNYDYTPFSYDNSKRSSSMQLPQTYPSPPVQFVRSTPSSLKPSSLCIQPSHLVQPLYLTTSSTPLSSALSNTASPNSFLTQQRDTFLPNPLIERPSSSSKPQQYYAPPGVYYDNAKLRFDLNTNASLVASATGETTAGTYSNHTSQSKHIVTPTTRKRKRRKYREIKRYYKCQYGDCDKSYGTLNHLNFHIQLQKHGAKRLASEFKDIRNLAKED